MRLLSGVASDYLNGLVSLGVLVQKIEALLGVIGDREFRNALFDDLLALDEVHAMTRIGEFDFAKYGKPVVDSAVHAIINKTHAYSTWQRKPD